MATRQYVNHLLILNGAFFSSSCFSGSVLVSGEWIVGSVIKSCSTMGYVVNIIMVILSQALTS